MFRKIIGSGNIVVPYLRFTTSSGVDLDPTMSASTATFQWISPDGSISTGTTPNPTLDQTGVYTLKCSDWANCTTFDCRTDNLTKLDNLFLLRDALVNLYCFGNALTMLNASGLATVQTILCYENDLTTVMLPATDTLTNINIRDNTSLTELDLSMVLKLETLGAKGCALETIELASHTALDSITVYDNGFSQAVVDKVLADVVTAGVSGGSLNMGGSNAIPSAAGLASKATLDGDGWTVTVST